MKLELLTNATVVDDAIRFISEKSKDKDRQQVKSSSDSGCNKHNKESKEPDYDAEKSDKADEQEQKPKAAEEKITTNRVF